MSSELKEPSLSSDSSVLNPLERFAAYQFDSDETYQQGLASLIDGGAFSGNPTPENKEECRLLKLSRCSVTGNDITSEQVLAYELSLRKPSDVALSESTSIFASHSHEARNLTLAELQEMIETGRVDQIPNNKVIPERFNDAPPSHSIAPARKKPWEVAVAGVVEDVEIEMKSDLDS
ncbi:hypothetical protein H0H81_005373 [Sphagnurus paluster]|uniref:Uncharacterized protein n=1 Tax=Sphagnurus paluster TaxID=117069 RepID=A0A9P7FXS5_9AGAR|nr:hypothetical protein H0H81_005373 [Sphagnurus paluster]